MLNFKACFIFQHKLNKNPMQIIDLFKGVSQILWYNMFSCFHQEYYK